ncbi:TolC family protein [Leptospira sp. 96542]|nr:TolC family protein [Leptospira sp. 96542]
MIRILILTTFLFSFSCIPSLPKRDHQTLELPNEFPQWENSTESENLANQIWTEFYKDPQLVSLVDDAIQNNQELAILEQEINISNNEIMARHGEYLPKLALQGGTGLEKTERFSTPDANSPTLFTRGGLVMSWEVDIWKKLRNATKAAYLRYLSGIEGRRYVLTNLVSEVSNTYYELILLDNQLELVENYIEVLTKVKDMVVLQRDAGRATSLGVKRFEAEVAKNIARRYDLKQNISITENKLNQLVGRFPKHIDRQPKNFLLTTLPEIKNSVPVKLLENRPDIKQASLNLEAKKLDVDVARANFYPSLTIDGNVGYEAFNSKHFDGTPVSMAYGIGGGLVMPLLNRKAIKANYLSADNLQIQSIYNYELTLIKAFTEVSNQMIKIKNLNSRYEMKSKQVSDLHDSLEIANILFKAGRVDYIEVLLTQRDFIESQFELLELKETQLVASVGLYKAIGGGWRGQKETTMDPHWEP